MFEQIKRIWATPELHKRIVFTLACLVACRIGTFIPVPGINSELALNFIRYATGGGQNIFQLVDVFSGGAFAKMTIFALGVMPYISASILLQMGMIAFPGLQREMRENPEQGKRKVNRLTRYLAVGLAVFQSLFFAREVLSFNHSRPGIIFDPMLESEILGTPWLFFATTAICMTAGTMILMWIGEQISEKGIGNGVSLIIGLGIVSSLPGTIGSMLQQVNLDSQEIGELTFSSLVVLCGVFVAIIVGTILIIQGQRKIPLQYARRTIGRRETEAAAAHIPLKVNYAGVVPVIMASTFLMLPATIAWFAGQGTWLGSLAVALSPGSGVYTTLFVLLIVFFTYFWTGISFHPDQIASDLKKNGAFIPGIRQGHPTEDYLSATMSRVTLIGAGSLALIAILPTLVATVLGVDPTISQFFGGTSLLIVVGVVLDTMKQIESHLVMQRYDGFMRGPGRSRLLS